MSGVAIFVKTPGRSPVKSRLAAERGRQWTEDWYRLAAAAVAAVASEAGRRAGATAYWAVAEPAAITAGDWTGLPTIAQGEGGLGERMARVLATLVARHGRGLLLGADAPQVSSALLLEAIAWLDDGSPRLTLGPARDGGFWCVGANVAPPEAAWTGVEYGTSATGRAFRAALAPYGAWHELPMLTDADHAADLPLVLAELTALPAPLAAQRELIAWMRRS